MKQFVLQNSGSQDDLKDVYQEAFLAVWRNIQLDKFQPQNDSSLGGYIYQVAKNKWLDHLRSAKHKKEIAMADKDVIELQDESLPDGELNYLNAVKEHYQQLGKQCKELLHLFYFKDESMKDIASRFSWTEASARNNKYRCLQKLREMVSNKMKQIEN